MYLAVFTYFYLLHIGIYHNLKCIVQTRAVSNVLIVYDLFGVTSEVYSFINKALINYQI